MTRETKIGLLVGLAFIIVIGILLSEHVSSTNEPPQAPFDGAGANVRDGVVSPGAADDAPPVSIAGTPVEAPRQTVPTNADLHPPIPPVTYVPSRAGRAALPRGAAANGTLAAGIDANASPGNVAAASPGDLVQQHANDPAPYDANGSAPSMGPGQAPQAGAALVAPARQAPATPPATYVAVAGDSVSRIAGRLMGGNTKANRDLLIRANPTLQNEANVVVIGRTYVIPKASTGSTGSASSPQPSSPFAVADGRAAGAQSAARLAEPSRWYTVKGDDNLWRIAESQLGSGTAWTQIRDLNKDLLKGGETVHPNMRLRLPAKTAVAGAD